MRMRYRDSQYSNASLAALDLPVIQICWRSVCIIAVSITLSYTDTSMLRTFRRTEPAGTHEVTVDKFFTSRLRTSIRGQCGGDTQGYKP
jgi:hypothetical protein